MQAEGLSQLSKPSLFHIAMLALPCRCGVFHVLSQYNSVHKTSKRRPGLVQCPSHMEIPKSAPPSSFPELKWRESIFHTSYPFLESYGQEAPQPTTLLPRVAGGKIQSGIQLCAIQSRIDLSSPSSPYHEHPDQCPSSFPTPAPHSRCNIFHVKTWRERFSHGTSWKRLRSLGPGKPQRKKQKSSNARDKKRKFNLSPFPITPPAFLSSKSKGSFHQEPPKTSFQFSELEECHFTSQLIFCPPGKFSSFKVTREKNHQFRSALTRPPDCGRPGLGTQLC